MIAGNLFEVDETRTKTSVNAKISKCTLKVFALQNEFRAFFPVQPISSKCKTAYEYLCSSIRVTQQKTTDSYDIWGL